MIDCLIIGDSIAVGIGQQMAECETRARIGAGTAGISRWATPAEAVVISAGTNDLRDTPALRARLRALRSRFGFSGVIWVLPANEAGRAVLAVATENYADTLVTFASGADGIHPRSYRRLAESVRAEMARRGL